MKKITLFVVYIFAYLAILAMIITFVLHVWYLLVLTFVFGAVAKIVYVDYINPLL